MIISFVNVTGSIVSFLIGMGTGEIIRRKELNKSMPKGLKWLNSSRIIYFGMILLSFSALLTIHQKVNCQTNYNLAISTRTKILSESTEQRDELWIKILSPSEGLLSDNPDNRILLEQLYNSFLELQSKRNDYPLPLIETC